MTPKGRIPVKLSDVVLLLYHMEKGAELPDIGFEDTNHTLAFIKDNLNRTTMVRKDLVESALWSCNLMNELGYFWHPHGSTFDFFTRQVLGTKYKFDKTYNLIVDKDKTNAKKIT